jgi:hypothetical protein
LDDAKSVIDWVHRPESWWFQNRVTGFEQIFCWDDNSGKRKVIFPSMVESAREWKQDGPNTAPSRLNGITPEGAWDHAWQALQASGFYRCPVPFHPNPEIAEAMTLATRHVGGAKAIGQTTDYSKGAVKRDWCRAFAANYGANHG